MNIASGTETGGRSDGGLCIADFFRDVGAAARDVIGLQVVTTGRRASEAAREWFADNRYQDYLYLHGLSVEMAEALAEYLHRCIRGELGFAAEEARDTEAVLNQGYRGSRYSFGYPACPNLADQRQLLALLKAAEIGIAFSEEDQLDPEQLTSADHRPSSPGDIFPCSSVIAQRGIRRCSRISLFWGGRKQEKFDPKGPSIRYIPC